MKNKQQIIGSVRALLLLLFSITTVVLVSACTPSSEQAGNEMQSQSLYAQKTSYVGDNSKVINILSQLYWTKEYTYSALQIQSENEPYGLNISLNMSEPIPFPTKHEHSALLSNAAILFALIDNLGYVEYQNNMGEKFILSRDEVSDFLKNHFDNFIDITAYGSSAEKFEELYLKMGYPWNEEMQLSYEALNIQQMNTVTDKYLPNEMTEDLDLFDYRMYQIGQNVDEMSFIKYIPSFDNTGNLLKIDFSFKKDQLTYYRVKDYGYTSVLKNTYGATGRYFYHVLQGDFSLLEGMIFDLSGSGNEKSMVLSHPERIENYAELFTKTELPEQITDLNYCRTITKEEAQRLANEFVHDVIDPNLELSKTIWIDDDYEEYFADESEQYLVHVNRELGFVQEFRYRPQ